MFDFFYKLWGRLGFLPFLDKLEPMPKDLLQEALDKETLRLGRVITIGLILFYTAFIFIYSFSVASDEQQILITAHTISIILLLVFVVITYLPFANRYAMILSVFASLVPLTNILHRLYVLQDPVITISLIISLLILSTIALDTGWLLCVIIYCYLGWLFVILQLKLPFDFTMAYYAAIFFISCVATFLICRTRCLTIRNYSNLRWHESLQRKALEEAQENLKAQNKELVHVDELKSAFLANMSHEFRTPLTAINGFAEVLENESFGTLNEKQKSYLNNISVSGRQLLDLVNNVLTLSSFDAQQVPMNLAESSIKSVIETALKVLKQDIDKKQIQIKLSLNAQDITYFDSVLINQVMLNLVSNALKFSEANSLVEIKTYEKDNNIIVEVIDSGIGIAEENHKLLFLPFSQVDASFNRSHEGAGLGLALCKRIIEQHGGEVFVSSRLGEGSIFGFSLPKVPVSATV